MTVNETVEGRPNLTAEDDAALNSAAQRIKSAYTQFVERVQPSIDLYSALGQRAKRIRKENEKLPL